jgi:hypothetical protein
MQPIQRTRVVLNMKRRKTPELITKAKAIYNAMSAAPTEFPSPVPTMAVFNGQIQELEQAEQATTTRARGTAAVRNAKAAVVVTSLESLQTYVQTLCDASPEQAATLIAAAAMHVALHAKREKAVLAAVTGPTTGDAKLTANRRTLVGKTNKRAAFHWQYSVDGGKTWVSAPSTPLASTLIHGLPPMTLVSFRVAATVAKVIGDFSQGVTLLVR